MTDDNPAEAQAPGNGDDAAGADAAPGGRGRRAAAGSARKAATGGKAGRRGRTGAVADPAEGDSADAPDAAVESGDDAGPGGAGLRTRDLVDRVAKATGMRRRAAKPVVEVVLAELAAALQEGRPMSLRPLGKITVARTRERGGSPILTVRIRPVTVKRAGETAAADPLAQSGEGG